MHSFRMNGVGWAAMPNITPSNQTTKQKIFITGCTLFCDGEVLGITAQLTVGIVS